MAGLIDKDAELARLAKETDKLKKEVARLEGKLNNPKFVDKAPSEVVDKERSKLAGQLGGLQKLEEQIAHIKAI
jgi:valyl-tRNA synthetase